MRRIVNNVEIVESIFDPETDLYAVFGRSIANSKKPFKAGWLSKDQDKFIELRHFSKEIKASDHFNAAAQGEISPESHTVYKDEQKHAVYAWEDEFLEPFTIPLSTSQIRKFVKQMSQDVGIEPPKVTFIKEGQASHYDPNEHAITFSHRDNLTTMHEMAHAIHAKIHEADGRDFVDHGPRFVWIAIDLYSKYANFDVQYLTVTANQAGILGDLNTPHIINVFRPQDLD